MAAPAPPPARTLLQVLAGSADTDTEERWSLPSDSPVITSWTFVEWDLSVVQARAAAPRSLVVTAILMAARPPLPAARPAFRTSGFLTAEMDHTWASGFMHQLDLVGAFDSVYVRAQGWIDSVPALWAKLPNPDLARLDA